MKIESKAVKSLINKLQDAEAICASAGSVHLVKPWSVHDESGKLLAISARAARLLGLEESSNYRHFLELIHLSDQVHLGRFLAGMADSLTLEFRPRSQCSATVAEWVEICLEENGCASEFSGCKVYTFRDISRIKEEEERSKELKSQAEQASIAKSRFLATMSHELRNPLNAIMGFADLLASPTSSQINDEKKAEYTTLIGQAAHHLLDVLNGILDMSKLEHGMYQLHPKKLNLSQSLSVVTGMMEPQAAERSIEIKVSDLDNLPQIVADERAISQIMINLLSNAIKFSSDGQNVKLSARRGARSVVLVVEDQGIGVSDEALKHLGTPFYQADSKYSRKYEGTGLGLSVVKGLIELHAGELNISSQPDVGTRVEVRLPIHGAGCRTISAPSNVNVIERIPVYDIRATDTSKEQDHAPLRILRDIA